MGLRWFLILAVSGLVFSGGAVAASVAEQPGDYASKQRAALENWIESEIFQAVTRNKTYPTRLQRQQGLKMIGACVSLLKGGDAVQGGVLSLYPADVLAGVFLHAANLTGLSPHSMARVLLSQGGMQSGFLNSTEDTEGSGDSHTKIAFLRALLQHPKMHALHKQRAVGKAFAGVAFRNFWRGVGGDTDFFSFVDLLISEGYAGGVLRGVFLKSNGEVLDIFLAPQVQGPVLTKISQLAFDTNYDPALAEVLKEDIAHVLLKAMHKKGGLFSSYNKTYARSVLDAAALILRNTPGEGVGYFVLDVLKQHDFANLEHVRAKRKAGLPPASMLPLQVLVDMAVERVIETQGTNTAAIEAARVKLVKVFEKSPHLGKFGFHALRMRTEPEYREQYEADLDTYDVPSAYAREAQRLLRTTDGLNTYERQVRGVKGYIGWAD